jgi:hypothetical protein
MKLLFGVQHDLIRASNIVRLHLLAIGVVRANTGFATAAPPVIPASLCKKERLGISPWM